MMYGTVKEYTSTSVMSEKQRMSRLSARQLCRNVRRAEESQLHEALCACSHEYPSFTAEPILLILTSYRKLSLFRAFERMQAAGFKTGPFLITKDILTIELKLELQDFELAFSMWGKIEDDAKTLLSMRFVNFWQSPAGATLKGDDLLRLKPIWEFVSPTQSRRLAPKAACRLGWSEKELVALLTTHVDLNGDTQARSRQAFATPSASTTHACATASRSW